jgi:uncharacterized protein (DUF924 family)
MSVDPAARELLDYWFGALDDRGMPPDDRYSLWFGANPEVDAQLADAFGALSSAAADGELDHWAASPEGRLALVLLTDQLPRNLHRDSPAAFAQDHKALACALEGIGLAVDGALLPIQRVFFYLPLEHAEDLGIQDRVVSLFEDLEREAPAGGERMFALFTDYARKHREVIARFGRFPHRNGVLGRTSTDEESAFLAEHGAGF